MKHFNLYLRWMFSLAVLVMLLLTPVGAAQAAEGPTLTVAVPALNLRQGPGTGYTIVDVLSVGDAGVATGRDASGAWLQVTMSGGRAGWVYGEFVKLSDDAAALPVVSAPAAATVSRAASRLAGGTIVFQVSSGGAIYAMNADGSNLRYLTVGMDPALSPDGRLVAFTRWMGSSTGVKGDLWVIGVDGSGERKVLGDVQQPKSPAWSRDGKTIILNIQRGVSLSRLMCIPQEMSLPPESVEIEQRGNMVCFKVARPLWRLRAVDVATGAFEDVPGDVISFAPALDPTNDWRVVYVGERGLVNLDVTRGNTWFLTDDPQDHTPTFSPDGRKIAVSYRQTDHWEVHVMNADGTGRGRLTSTPMTVLIDQQLAGQSPRSWNNAAPAWSPDGRQIAFLSDRNGRWEIWVMNADGSNQRLLLPASALGGASIRYEGMEERVISWR